MGRKPKGARGQAWIDQMFQAQAVKNGDVIRRKITSVDHFASAALLEKEVKKRGFHMVISGDQYIVLCNTGQFKLVL